MIGENDWGVGGLTTHFTGKNYAPFVSETVYGIVERKCRTAYALFKEYKVCDILFTI